ncbi:hypothetical protein [Variovorax sp. Root411]|uniref:hypothetical protein n=1 Tax=Variovorax sp. Root411 TaxID=1736530 RepID=UPI0006F8AC56|nr:hypothetical protein [Variovorax sp. Root411]KQW54305.1 hypothetical protein ASC92_19905 [Variovorax sp. Root411]
MKHTLTLLCVLALPLAASSVLAKLPAPTPEAQAKAAEAAARTAWSAKTDAYLLCKAQDQVAAKYRASAQSAGKPVPAAATTPPCVDPGPYAAAPAGETKPIEASGAHSPASTAASPPSTNQTSAQTNPAPKK